MFFFALYVQWLVGLLRIKKKKESYDYIQTVKAVVEYVLVLSPALDCWLLNVLETFESRVKITKWTLLMIGQSESKLWKSLSE